MSKHWTKAEKKWADQITQLGCIVCLLNDGIKTPAEVHHIDGKTKPACHLDTIPLCHLHHRGHSDTPRFTSIHPYKAAFVKRYGSERYLLRRTIELLEHQKLKEGRQNG